MATKKVESSMMKKIGAWAFVIGVILAIILGIFSTQLVDVRQHILGLLVIAGTLIGILNIHHRESGKFLIAALSLVIVSYMGGASMAVILENVAIVGPALINILNALLVLFIPTTIIVALKSLFEISKN